MTLHVTVSDLGDYEQTLTGIHRTLAEHFGIEHATVQIEPGKCAAPHAGPDSPTASPSADHS